MKTMNATQVRNLLGMFFLGTTSVLGAYIILFQETKLLPINAADADSAFKIIIPTLVAQLSVAFKWIANPPKTDFQIHLPSWAVLGPPIAVSSILLFTIVFLALDAGESVEGGRVFKNVVTFCVSLLGASTIFVLSAVFSETNTHEQKPNRIRDEDETR